MQEVLVHSPATVANVAAGFDIMGFALANPYDEILVRKTPEKGVRIVNETGTFPNMPLEPLKNTAGIALLTYLAKVKPDCGFELVFKKKIKPGSGIGSSAASAVAGVFGANELLGNPLKREELLPFVMEGETVASGVAHADNVGPALLGGFILVRSYTPLDVVKIDTPENLAAAVIHPQIEVRTEDARAILRKEVLLKNAIQQWGNTAGLIAGLMKGDMGLIGRSLDDVIIEPIRSILIPGFKEVKAAALKAGALGCSISGSGPSIFSLNENVEIAEKVAAEMKATFEAIGIPANAYVSKINPEGVKIA
ncbi:homoserine kinase [bacterium]|nr:MAG: homoserine kinase [bacterium]